MLDSPLGSIESSKDVQSNSNPYNDSSRYVKALLTKKKQELQEQISNYRLSNKSQSTINSSYEDFLKLKMNQIEKIISFLSRDSVRIPPKNIS